MMNAKFRGTGVALITPFLDNGEVDFDALKILLNHIISGGVNYILLMGTTAETPCLSAVERDAVVEFAKKIINRRVPIMLGMSSNNTQDLIEKIKNTDFTDIDGLLTASPFYNKPVQDGMYQHFARVAESSPVPVILYNIPGRTGVNIKPETICRLAFDYKNIIAVKEASGSIDQVMKIIANAPENFDVISGDDGLTLPMISVGATGVISVLANAFPKEWSLMVDKALNNEFYNAKSLHYKYLEAVNLMFAEGNPAGVKAYLAQMGIIKNVLRLPLVKVSDALYDKIELNRKGF